MGNDVGLKVDGAVSSQLANVAQAASKLERRGYDCCWTAEINHDPFLPLVLAAEHTTRIKLGTSIAVAFARNPMTVANIGWDLQAYSDGRFILGLGSQVQPHREAVQHAVGSTGAAYAGVRGGAARDLGLLA
jgi:alkanesulfonate monooxygenase SsuD/methylene tetrahydromethanopterin reductase-like flavin-dependent oxidoreductase (luciferase family)